MAKGSVRRLDTKCFNQAIGELNEAMEAFEQALSRIKSQTKKLQDAWDGKGADRFDKVYKRLKKEFDDQSENLTAIRDDLKVMLETYEKWDSETKKTISENNAG